MRKPLEKRTARRSAGRARRRRAEGVMSAETEITEQLGAFRGDDRGDERRRSSWDVIVPLVYNERRAMAHRLLQCERDSHTLSTTALVHEAFLRLADQPSLRWHNESHFFAIAARVMRQVLIDYARYHRAAKRMDAVPPLELDALAEREPEQGTS